MDEQHFPEEPLEEPLDFEHRQHLCYCPYCGETLASDELENYMAPGSNTIVCPNCRKRLNIHELGGSL